MYVNFDENIIKAQTKHWNFDENLTKYKEVWYMLCNFSENILWNINMNMHITE